jgi:signal transduction histidine kinase
MLNRPSGRSEHLDRSPSVSRVTGTSSGLPQRRASDRDTISHFQRPLLGFRILVLALSAVTTLLAGVTQQNAIGLLATAVWTIIRGADPIRLRSPRLTRSVPLMLDLVVLGSIIGATGNWTSPFTVALLPTICVAGCVRSGMPGLGAAAITGMGITTVGLFSGTLTTSSLASGVRWTGVLMVVSLLAGNGQRLVRDAMKQEEAATQRMQELQQANSLLFDLQRVARRLPSSLDLAEVLRTTVAEFSGATGYSRVSVLLLDEDKRWSVAEAIGASMPMELATTDLPTAARNALSLRTTALAEPGAHALMGTPGTELSSGAYCALVSRDRVIGMLVGECAERDTVNEVLIDKDMLSLAREFAGPAAVAIDNARWFGRIKSVAAADERVRIARDLHDRIGQSLALLGFEVDRISRRADAAPLKDELDVLRTQVRSAVSEVRETLYDLRTEVTAEESITAVLQEFLDRVHMRSHIETSLSIVSDAPLPPRIGRELWHIAQEAIVNAERHARCKSVGVTVRLTTSSAAIDVVDDGIGFESGSGRPDSYGLRGLRERAASLGARLEVSSAAGAGTTVRVRVSDFDR